jgi:hypothetical protein
VSPAAAWSTAYWIVAQALVTQLPLSVPPAATCRVIGAAAAVPGRSATDIAAAAAATASHVARPLLVNIDRPISSLPATTGPLPSGGTRPPIYE